jgi:hypothetical protein
MVKTITIKIVFNNGPWLNLWIQPQTMIKSAANAVIKE